MFGCYNNYEGPKINAQDQQNKDIFLYVQMIILLCFACYLILADGRALRLCVFRRPALLFCRMNM